MEISAIIGENLGRIRRERNLSLVPVLGLHGLVVFPDLRIRLVDGIEQTRLLTQEQALGFVVSLFQIEDRGIYLDRL